MWLLQVYDEQDNMQAFSWGYNHDKLRDLGDEYCDNNDGWWFELTELAE